MRKQWVIALCFVLMSSILVTAAGPKGESEIVRITGVIMGIDYDADQITVAVDEAEVQVQVTPDTLITIKRDPFAFGSLEVGMTVQVCGKMVGDILMADLINVRYLGK